MAYTREGKGQRGGGGVAEDFLCLEIVTQSCEHKGEGGREVGRRSCQRVPSMSAGKVEGEGRTKTHWTMNLVSKR